MNINPYDDIKPFEQRTINNPIPAGCSRAGVPEGCSAVHLTPQYTGISPTKGGYYSVADIHGVDVKPSRKLGELKHDEN